MFDLSRLPDSITYKFNDADIDEAVYDIKSWNKEITPEKQRYIEDTKLRSCLVYIFSIIIFLWLASVISILYFNNNLLNLKLSDNVLIVLLTTTTINTIGMMLIILRNLFPQITSITNNETE